MVNLNIAGRRPKCAEHQVWSCCSWLEAKWQEQATKNVPLCLFDTLSKRLPADVWWILILLDLDQNALSISSRAAVLGSMPIARTATKNVLLCWFETLIKRLTAEVL